MNSPMSGGLTETYLKIRVMTRLMFITISDLAEEIHWTINSITSIAIIAYWKCGIKRISFYGLVYHSFISF